MWPFKIWFYCTNIYAPTPLKELPTLFRQQEKGVIHETHGRSMSIFCFVDLSGMLCSIIIVSRIFIGLHQHNIIHKTDIERKWQNRKYRLLASIYWHSHIAYVNNQLLISKWISLLAQLSLCHVNTRSQFDTNMITTIHVVRHVAPVNHCGIEYISKKLWFDYFSILNCSGIWNSSPCKTIIRLSCIGNARVVGDLATHGARISATTVSTYFARNISISAPDRVTLWPAYWQNICNTFLQSGQSLILLIWSVVDIMCFVYHCDY